MYGKSYEAKKILTKKPKRLFPKEVVKEVNAPEDLFSVLFAENIKGIKQKVKVEKNCRTGGGKTTVSRKPNVSVVEETKEYAESREIENNRSRKNKSKERSPSFLVKNYESSANADQNVNKNKYFTGKHIYMANKSKQSCDDSWFRLLDDNDDDSFNEIFEGRMKPFGPDQNCFGKYISHKRSEQGVSTQDTTTDSEKRHIHQLVCSTPAQSNNCMKNILCELSPVIVKDDNDIKKNFKCTRNVLISNEKENIAIEKIPSDDELSEISHFNDLFITSSKNGDGNDDKDVHTVSKLSSDNECSSVSKLSSKGSLKSHAHLHDDNLQHSSRDIFEETELSQEEDDFQHADGQKHSDLDPFASSCNSETKDPQDCHQSSSDNNDKDHLKGSVFSFECETSEQPLKKTYQLSNRAVCRKSSSSCGELSNSGVGNEFQSPASICRFNSRKSHVVVPLASWDTQSKRSTGFRRAYIANNQTARISISPDTSFLAKSAVGNELQSPESASCFSSRKLHMVVPLESWDNEAKLSTGFRQAHVACTDNKTTRHSISLDSSFSVDETNQHTLSFKNLVLQHCGQSDILNFSEEFPESSCVKCTKVGEGAYGEVFSRRLSCGRSTVLKIIPVEGYYKINGEIQKNFEEILSEIVITMELSNLQNAETSCTSNFPEMIACRCVQGRYPSQLLELWEQYAEEKDSENDCPEILPEDQIFIILELANVGSALEQYVFNSAEQTYSVFMQVTYALAVAETILEFEHRDLHWGNILIEPTKTKKIHCKFAGKEFSIATNGIKASVIDFTLSRMTFDGCSIFNNLADDPAIFEGSGDYQFDIYRLMKDHTNNKWQVFEPYTNVLWLSYVLDKLVTEVYYRNKTTKTHKRGMDKLEDMRGRILEYKSAVDVAQSFNI